jgi:hypothetical protein
VLHAAIARHVGHYNAHTIAWRKERFKSGTGDRVVKGPAEKADRIVIGLRDARFNHIMGPWRRWALQSGFSVSQLENV